MSSTPPNAAVRQLFLVPDLHGRPTGGTVYNSQLVRALRALGSAASVAALDDAGAALSGDDYDFVWLDSIYLEQARALKDQLGARARFGLLLHYLPSLVAAGSNLERFTLSTREGAALANAELALVTSEFMRAVLTPLAPGLPVLCVTPGSEYPRAATLPAVERGVEALLVAHVVPGKGIEPFLTALAEELRESDRFRLRIAGDATADSEYALRCRGLVAENPSLRARVSFEGLLAEPELRAAFSAANLLVSASAMESYGMALADARRVGLPLLARDAGNVREHVSAAAGGELVADPLALARAALRLAREPAEHALRLARAAKAALPARPWEAAAAELIAALRPSFGS